MTNYLAVSAISDGQRLGLAASGESEGQAADADGATNADEMDDGYVRAPSPSEVLAIMSDPYARAIIAATAEQPVSVADIVDDCEMSTATAYRKVNRLVDTGLLEEQVRIRPEGTNLSEFVLSVDAIHVVLTEGGVPEVTFSVKPQTDDGTLGRLSTDGGVTQEESADTAGQEGKDADDLDDEPTTDSRQRQLQKLFLDVTGTDELVEKQDPEIQSRYLDDGDESMISGYVTNLARDDGLADALPASDAGDQG